MTKFFIITIFILPLFLLGQNHTQFWTRGVIQYKWNKRLNSSLELHHRTQSMVNAESPFSYPLANAFRLWISYKISSQQFINFSPYAFFSNDPTVNKSGDELKSNINERRLHLQYESKYPLAKKWSLNNRNGVEFRIFENQSNLLRLRFREGIEWKQNKKMKWLIYDEIFLNTINIDAKHILDQNRVGLQMTYMIDQHFKFDLGANLIHSLSKSNLNISRNFMFFWNIYYLIN